MYLLLGGNRCSHPRWLLNILVVFVLSGLWHGANWSFLAWGLVHAILYLAVVLSRPWRLVVLGRFAGFEGFQRQVDMDEWISVVPRPLRWFWYCVLMVVILNVGATHEIPFVYFQF